jgi:hypothetical protein
MSAALQICHTPFDAVFLKDYSNALTMLFALSPFQRPSCVHFPSTSHAQFQARAHVPTEICAWPQHNLRSKPRWWSYPRHHHPSTELLHHNQFQIPEKTFVIYIFSTRSREEMAFIFAPLTFFQPIFYPATTAH